jgi:DNA invertase Pin-like site-specific DNA recombinase
MKFAIYCRVSTDKQNNENQVPQLRRFVRKEGGTVSREHEYVDVATGSGKKARERFQAMMDAASRREFDCVLFWKLDRFSREGVRRTLYYLTQLDGWKVGWRSFQEQWFDSCGPFKDAVISIMATLAEQERIAISERTKAGLARVRRAGTKLGRPRKTVNMRRVRELRAKGLSLREIAQRCKVSSAFIWQKLRKERTTQ